jgi:hypothetical protein
MRGEVEKVRDDSVSELGMLKGGWGTSDDVDSSDGGMEKGWTEDTLTDHPRTTKD